MSPVSTSGRFYTVCRSSHCSRRSTRTNGSAGRWTGSGGRWNGRRATGRSRAEARDVPEPGGGAPPTEIPEAAARELDESGVTMDDIDETIAVYLAKLDVVEPVGG